MNRFSRIAILGLQQLLLIFFSNSVYCQDLTSEEFSASFEKPIIDYGQIIYAVLFLMIMIIIALFLVKKSQIKKSTSSDLINIVYNYAITSKDKLLIANIGKEYLLLGLSNTGIRKLHVLDEEYIHKIISEKNIKTNEFANILVNLAGKHRSA